LLQSPLATAADRTLSGLAGGGLSCGVESLVRLGKGPQQALELRERQARESQELAAVGPECFLLDDVFIFFLYSNRMNLAQLSTPVAVHKV
jgi:hypothetical protein